MEREGLKKVDDRMEAGARQSQLTTRGARTGVWPSKITMADGKGAGDGAPTKVRRPRRNRIS
jgi:hypothetical protein